MNSRRDGIPLAIFLTFMNVWGAIQFGVPIWEAWGDVPAPRVGILLLAGIAFACLSHVWAQVLGYPSHKRAPVKLAIPCPPSMEGADV